MSKKEKHHNIPVSFYGPDRKENLVDLDPKDHKLIHKHQNISHQSVRKFRMKTNHLDKGSDEFKRNYANILLRYFAGVVFLPARLITVQANALKALVIAVSKERGKEPPEEPQGLSPTQRVSFWVIHASVLAAQFYCVFIFFT